MENFYKLRVNRKLGKSSVRKSFVQRFGSSRNGRCGRGTATVSIILIVGISRRVNARIRNDGQFVNQQIGILFTDGVGIGNVVVAHGTIEMLDDVALAGAKFANAVAYIDVFVGPRLHKFAGGAGRAPANRPFCKRIELPRSCPRFPYSLRLPYKKSAF